LTWSKLRTSSPALIWNTRPSSPRSVTRRWALSRATTVAVALSWSEICACVPADEGVAAAWRGFGRGVGRLARQQRDERDERAQSQDADGERRRGA
jgi:hypothetical protein